MPLYSTNCIRVRPDGSTCNHRIAFNLSRGWYHEATGKAECPTPEGGDHAKAVEEQRRSSDDVGGSSVRRVHRDRRTDRRATLNPKGSRVSTVDGARAIRAIEGR